MWHHTVCDAQFLFKIDSLEQQIKGDKRFLEEQATEREEFTRRIEHLEEVIKRKEKEEDKEISMMASSKVRINDWQWFYTEEQKFVV